MQLLQPSCAHRSARSEDREGPANTREVRRMTEVSRKQLEELSGKCPATFRYWHDDCTASIPDPTVGAAVRLVPTEPEKFPDWPYDEDGWHNGWVVEKVARRYVYLRYTKRTDRVVLQRHHRCCRRLDTQHGFLPFEVL